MAGTGEFGVAASVVQMALTSGHFAVQVAQAEGHWETAEPLASVVQTELGGGNWAMQLAQAKGHWVVCSAVQMALAGGHWAVQMAQTRGHGGSASPGQMAKVRGDWVTAAAVLTAWVALQVGATSAVHVAAVGVCSGALSRVQ